jgi:ribosomal protein L4
VERAGAGRAPLPQGGTVVLRASDERVVLQVGGGSGYGT